MKTKELTITYRDQKNNRQIKTVRVGDLMLIHTTIVQMSNNRTTGVHNRSEYEEDELCSVHSFVKDAQNNYTSFVVTKLTQKRMSSITKRVYFSTSNGIPPQRFTFLKGTADDYPEYFL